MANILEVALTVPPGGHGNKQAVLSIHDLHTFYSETAAQSDAGGCQNIALLLGGIDLHFQVQLSGLRRLTAASLRGFELVHFFTLLFDVVSRYVSGRQTRSLRGSRF